MLRSVYLVCHPPLSRINDDILVLNESQLKSSFEIEGTMSAKVHFIHSLVNIDSGKNFPV